MEMEMEMEMENSLKAGSTLTEQEIKNMLVEQFKLFHELSLNLANSAKYQELVTLTKEMREIANYLFSSSSLPNVL